ncbi:MAG: methyltransferase domain-containing protein [Gordonibacter sp.]|uniref:class I SAM-dependent methyltransferase n=1 Tax=Gordonibacter sp. TaxID=1968902 RepID=UPI002FC8CE18
MGHNPLEYDGIAEQLYAPVYPIVARAIVERTGKRQGRVLDVGCGGGHLGFAVLKQGNFTSLSLFDENEQALDVAQRRAEERGLAEQVEGAYAGDVCTLELPAVGGKPFDLIVSRGSMPFWEDQRAAFANLFGLLAPGGRGYVGGGLGSAELAADIAERMAALRAENGGEGPHLFDRSRSKALDDDAYLELFAELGGTCEVIANKGEGHWIMFGKLPS